MSIRTILRVAEAELGYLEKRSEEDLDSKTANAGKGNYTKYWRDLKPEYQGQPWCNCFVNWVFMRAYGRANALRLLCCKGFDYYTPDTAVYFKKAGRWSNTPSVGDVIYFKNSERIHHVGIVVDLTKDTVVTIEGNTSPQTASQQVVSNGGGVWKKSYRRTHSAIAGYGHPDYASITMPFVRRLYLKALGREPDQAGYSHWTNSMAVGETTGVMAGKGFFLGPEYIALKRSNLEYIDDLYAALLGRKADAAGKKHWAEMLNDDKMTRTEVLKGFCLSAEYGNVCFNYGVDRGKW